MTVLLCIRLDHDVAIDEDGADDREGEERMCEHVDRDPADGVKWREHEQRLVSREPEDRTPLRDDDERALVLKQFQPILGCGKCHRVSKNVFTIYLANLKILYARKL